MRSQPLRTPERITRLHELFDSPLLGIPNRTHAKGSWLDCERLVRLRLEQLTTTGRWEDLAQLVHLSRSSGEESFHREPLSGLDWPEWLAPGFAEELERLSREG